MEETKKIIYDIESIPEGWELAFLIEIFENRGFLLWDSYKGGNPPVLFDASEDIEIVDIRDDGKN